MEGLTNVRSIQPEIQITLNSRVTQELCFRHAIICLTFVLVFIGSFEQQIPNPYVPSIAVDCRSY